jgi:hypothetical protein
MILLSTLNKSQQTMELLVNMIPKQLNKRHASPAKINMVRQNLIGIQNPIMSF